MISFAVGDELTTREQLDALPLFAVILDTGEVGVITAMAPHAWQKRSPGIPEVFPEERLCTSDVDAGFTAEDLLADFISFVVLWLPAPVEAPAGAIS